MILNQTSCSPVQKEKKEQRNTKLQQMKKMARTLKERGGNSKSHTYWRTRITHHVHKQHRQPHTLPWQNALWLASISQKNIRHKWEPHKRSDSDAEKKESLGSWRNPFWAENKQGFFHLLLFHTTGGRRKPPNHESRWKTECEWCCRRGHLSSIKYNELQVSELLHGQWKQRGEKKHKTSTKTIHYKISDFCF